MNPKPTKLTHILGKCDEIIDDRKGAYSYRERTLANIIKAQIGYLSMLAEVDKKHAKPMQNSIITLWEEAYGEIDP